jgi:hypothetical protein
MSNNIASQIRFYNRRGVPILAINSADPITLLRDTVLALEDMAVLRWDTVTGIELGTRKVNDSDLEEPTDVSKSAWATLGEIIKNLPDGQRKNAVQANYQMNGKGSLDSVLNTLFFCPDRTIVFVQHCDQLLNQLNAHAAQQAIMNLRDRFAQAGCMLVLIDNDIVLPECLRSDVIVIDDPLPTRDEIEESVLMIAENSSIDISEQVNATLGSIVDAVAGLPKFQAEQALALSYTADGFDLPTLWREKKKLVDQAHGLSVHYEGVGFDGVGGLLGIKNYFHRLMNGPKPPQLIVWIDEIEKSGIAHTGDSNGINADALGLLLSHIEDHNSYCVSLTGLPGTGKSLVAKTVGVEFNRMVVRLDIGAMKGSYVGESEARLRAALRLISALSQDNAMFIATSNTVSGLDTALRSRFVDTFFFPLPTSEELAPVWEIHKRKYGMSGDNPEDTNWVARNVKQCVERAYRLGMDLEEAAETVIPTGVAMSHEVSKLNEQAHGRFLSATTGFRYEYEGAF